MTADHTHTRTAPTGADSQLWYARAALADPLSYDDETLREAANILLKYGATENRGSV